MPSLSLFFYSLINSEKKCCLKYRQRTDFFGRNYCWVKIFHCGEKIKSYLAKFNYLHSSNVNKTYKPEVICESSKIEKDIIRMTLRTDGHHNFFDSG